MKITPIRDNIVAKRIEERDEKKVGSIIIPDTAKEKPMTAGTSLESRQRWKPESPTRCTTWSGSSASSMRGHRSQAHADPTGSASRQPDAPSHVLSRSGDRNNS